MNKIDIRSMSLKEMEEVMLDIGEKGFRAKQIYEWINKKHVSSFAQMANIPNSLKVELEDKTFFSDVSTEKRLVSKDDSTIKYLFGFSGNNITKTDKTYVESVLMRYSHGNTVCVSTQAGCKMGCAFCASTQNGLERNLTAGEMAAQIYEISRDTGERVSNVVLMGSGEPLDNFENTLKFIYIINSKEGLNIGQRHITLSTCGIVGKIYELLEKNLQITLAVSLHAPNDEIRKKLMPVAKKYPMAELIKACKMYSDITKRRVTFEYAMIDGINDSKGNAVELSKILKNMLCHVNLIPVNEASNRNLKKSGKEKIEIFSQTLKENNIEVTVRRKLGSDIDAACGQLKSGLIKF